MPGKEKETKKPSSRERMLSLARERYPDRRFDDIGAAPTDGAADLDDAIDEILEDYASQKRKADEENSHLAELLATDPSSAEFLQKWVDTGDPRTALVEVFGDDLGMTDEGREKFKGQLEGWRARKKEADDLEKEAESNWSESLSALDAWGDSKGLSMEEKRDVMLKLIDITAGGIMNRYSDFDLALNAIRHDSDVAEARKEGEVAGRNERIAAARRERGASGAMPPAPTGGQGATVSERKPASGRKSPWAGIK